MTKHERIAAEIEQTFRDFVDALKRYDEELMMTYEFANKTYRITSDTPVNDAIALIDKRDDIIRLWREQNPLPTKESFIAAKLLSEYGPMEEENAEMKLVITEANEFANEVTPYLHAHGWSWPPERQKQHWKAYNEKLTGTGSITERKEEG